VHRAYFRITGGRRGLWKPRPGRWGTLRLTTVGRRSGRERVAIVGYYEDGPDLVTMAMNGWAEPEPARRLNLQAHPDASVELKDETRAVHGCAAEDEEGARVWARWQSSKTTSTGTRRGVRQRPLSSSSSHVTRILIPSPLVSSKTT
jgi:deazaflavin-dependent oxidoreductase (nitroreductase family)